MTDVEKAILQLTMLIDLFDDLSVNSNCVSVLLGREDEQALKTAIEALQENESLARTVNEASELLRKQRLHGEWTTESAIDYLTEIGWLPEHDRILTDRQHGEWKRISIDKYIRHASCFYRCSVCGEDTIGETNFCPNCGSDNRKRGEAE